MKLELARLEVFQHLFAAVAEEMGATLMRSAFSPNIKERRDFSCAVFDATGRMLAQAAHIPIHLGSIPLCVAAAMREVAMQRGDAVILNDPYRGGTHLPDITLVSPVFLRGRARPDFYVANRAHHADVGGAHPGSMAPAADVHAEGLRIPPIKLIERGRVRADVLELCLANMRVPAERKADLLAQSSANRIGEQRLDALAIEHGRSTLLARSAQLLAWTERLTDDLLRSLPRGRRTFEDVLDPLTPGGAPIAIRVALERRGRELVIDLRASDAQVGDGLNATRAVALSAAFYCLRLLLPAGTPTNDGLMTRVRVLTREGTVCDASYPAPVAAGNVETSQRLVDVLLGAFAKLVPGRIPAASSGTMSNLAFGGADARGAAFTYYETIAGGAGASSASAGAHAVHTHMTNTRNTPIEAFERLFPVRVTRYGVRRDSGGAGEHRGGDGIEKRLLFLAPCAASWTADRQTRGPWGLAGGERGAAGEAWLVRKHAGRSRLASRANFALDAGDELEIATPGGGGFGQARRRRKK
jgi:N-methylhydantoinase B